jgi:hypothetical protein
MNPQGAIYPLQCRQVQLLESLFLRFLATNILFHHLFIESHCRDIVSPRPELLTTLISPSAHKFRRLPINCLAMEIALFPFR